MSQVKSSETTRGNRFLTPRVDIFENDQELMLFVELPGVRSEDIDVNFERGELTLRAKVQPRSPGPTVLVQEYEPADFFRAFQIHEAIDGNRIDAKCKHGLLTVRLPKLGAAQPRKVNVQG